MATPPTYPPSVSPIAEPIKTSSGSTPGLFVTRPWLLFFQALLAQSASSGPGDVTATGTLTASQLIVGAGGTTIAALGTLGSSTTVLHGNALGAPSFAAVSLTSEVSGVLPIANGGGLSGTYTPTLTAVANVSASTAFACQYLRVGATVTVSGRVDIDPTTTLVATQLGMSLPIASALTTAQQCAGVAFASAIQQQGAAIVGDAANDRAEVQFIPVDVTNQPYYFTFTYQVL